jgi:uncharacterized protein (TIRG00374 family)
MKRDEDQSRRSKLSGQIRGQLRNIIGFGVSAACIAFMAWRIDFHQIGTAISSFNWPYLIIGFSSLAVGYSMRILRWSIMLRAAGAQLSFSRCVAPFLGSIALNNVLPARLGDVIRAVVFPAALGITRTASTGSLVLERLIDLATLLCFLTVALLAFPNANVPDGVKFSATTLAVLTFMGLLAVVALSGVLSGLCLRWSDRDFGEYGSFVRRALVAVSSLLTSFKAMSRPPVMAYVVVLSALAWAGEAGLFWALLAGFGISASPAAAGLVMAIATLATLVPSSPGYVGPFHLAAFAATTILGSSPEVAASFAVLAHAAIWLPTTLGGAISILANPDLFGGVGPKVFGKFPGPSVDHVDE